MVKLRNYKIILRSIFFPKFHKFLIAKINPEWPTICDRYFHLYIFRMKIVVIYNISKNLFFCWSYSFLVDDLAISHLNLENQKKLILKNPRRQLIYTLKYGNLLIFDLNIIQSKAQIFLKYYCRTIIVFTIWKKNRFVNSMEYV